MIALHGVPLWCARCASSARAVLGISLHRGSHSSPHTRPHLGLRMARKHRLPLPVQPSHTRAATLDTTRAAGQPSGGGPHA